MRTLTFCACIVALVFPTSAIQAAQSSATITGRVIDGSTQAPIGGARVILVPGAGQTVAGPDLRLTKGGAISGRILDARGEPTPEVMVTAVRKPTGDSGRRGAFALPEGQPGQTNDIGSGSTA